MKLKKMKALTFILISMASVGFLEAQTIDEIIQNHIENSGGEKAWNSVKTIKIAAKMSVPQAEIKMNIMQKKPNMIYTETEVMGQKIIQGFDGETAWMINPMMGTSTPQPMTEDMKQQLLQNAQDMESDWIRFKGKGHEVTLEGEETIDGVETFKVKIIKNKNNDKPESTAFFFFDTENYIPIVMRMVMDDTTTPPTTIQTKLSEYKETNLGILMPHHFETEMMGQTTVLVFDEVVMNEDMSDSLFKMPSE